MHKLPSPSSLLIALLIGSLLPSATNAQAPATPPNATPPPAEGPPQSLPANPLRCANFSVAQLRSLSQRQHTAIPARFGSPVLSTNGAATLTLSLPVSGSKDEAWRGWLFCSVATAIGEEADDSAISADKNGTSSERKSIPVPVEAVYRPTEIERRDELVVQLRLPDLPIWSWSRGEILVVAIDAQQNAAFAYSRETLFGSRGFAVFGSLFLCLTAYVLLAGSVSKARARKAGRTNGGSRDFFRCLNPVRLTAGVGGGASLSKLQTLIFSAAVGFLVLFVLLRTGQLTELSSDILMLLGISAGGAVGGKLTATVKTRLSMESFAWIMDKHWIPEEAKRPDSGTNPALDRALGRSEGQPVRWADLVMSGGEFDVYKFQLALFSLVVTIGLLTTSMTGLTTFTVPDTLLQVLGLSQVVYIGGKAASPNSYNDLDKKVKELQRLEMAFLKAVAEAWKQAPPTGNKTLTEAKKAAPIDYAAYLKAAKEGVAMFESLLNLTVEDSKLEPDLKTLR